MLIVVRKKLWEGAFAIHFLAGSSGCTPGCQKHIMSTVLIPE